LTSILKHIATPSKQLLFVLKFIISIGLLYFISQKIISAIETNDFLDIELSKNWCYFALLVPLFTIINWGLEAKKWQFLTANTQQLTYRQAFGSVLAGLSTGLVTPNRLGNFIGRNVYIEKSNQVRSVYETQLGNLSQFLISILVGVLAFSATIIRFEISINPILVFILALFVLILGLILYFKLSLITKFKLGQWLYKKDKANINYIINIPLRLKFTILTLSLVRYFVFIFQYNLIFLVFTSDYSILDISLLSATTFLMTTIIPSLFFGKLLVRESSALIAFSWASISVPLIIIVSFSLWFINLAVPGIVGLIIWLKKLK